MNARTRRLSPWERITARLSAWAMLAVRGVPDELGGRAARAALYRRAFARFGRGSSFAPGIIVGGQERISVGDGCSMMAGGKLYAHRSEGLAIGNRCSFNHNVYISAADGGKVAIGDCVLIGPNSVLRAADHVFADRDRPIREQGHRGDVIVIEDDVWIAANCVVVGGVKIGKGSVIAAGSVVVKDVPPMQVWGGVPAKFLKER